MEQTTTRVIAQSLWMQRLADFIYQDRQHHVHLILRAATATTLFFGMNSVSSVFLFISTLIILIRWRGAFNGGSDFMTLAVLTGLLITHVSQPLVGQRWHIVQVVGSSPYKRYRLILFRVR
jgi:hypothetical protein